MRRATALILGLTAITWLGGVHAEVTVLAVRLRREGCRRARKVLRRGVWLKRDRPRRAAAHGNHHALRRHDRRSQSWVIP